MIEDLSIEKRTQSWRFSTVGSILKRFLVSFSTPSFQRVANQSSRSWSRLEFVSIGIRASWRGEELHKYLQEFEVVCSSTKPPGVTEEQIKLTAFPFSLMESAKDWFYYLPAGSITTWVQLKKKFLEKYFPASRVASLRKEICGIKQQPRETLYAYWERFNKLCTRCPQHQISD